jgi:syntaxin 17
LKKQRPTIDSIEKNVLNTEESIESGSGSLRSALAYKSLTTAASGAVLGTLVGGPVGFLAGAKLGAVVGLSGGVAGYFLGKYMTKPSRE